MAQEAGLAPLVLSLAELLRQLMEAQILRRMDAGALTAAEMQRAGDSLQALEHQILNLCEVLDIDPNQLNLDLGEFGQLLPPRGSYYPGQPSSQCSILELLDRLVTTGVVLEGEVEIGLAQMQLIQLKLKLLLTALPSSGTDQGTAPLPPSD
ncbi:MAG: gas vesicle protein K [Oscillatoriales cyanobacterium SM2_2_1]|nr:gas vesicle protein K [Oscillatoriales cyanobacterium SM2_2_1]